MRPVIFLIFSLFLSACVSSGKFKRTTAEFDARNVVTDSLLTVQRDSIQSLIYALERAKGGNEALLTAQERLQDRLIEQDNQIQSVRGNLSSTSSQLQRQLDETRAERDRARGNRDSVLEVQREIILDFQDRVDDISSLVVDSLEILLQPGQYFVTNRPGEVTVSIQEDALFRKGSVSTLVGGADDVLRIMAEVLQRDPLMKLTVTGHTDNQPNPRRGTDNWEYAALRATAINNELARSHNLSPNRLIAASQGEFGPARSNSTEEGRRFNRRIDFVFANNVGNLTRQLSKLIPKQED